GSAHAGRHRIRAGRATGLPDAPPERRRYRTHLRWICSPIARPRGYAAELIHWPVVMGTFTGGIWQGGCQRPAARPCGFSGLNFVHAEKILGGYRNPAWRELLVWV